MLRVTSYQRGALHFDVEITALQLPYAFSRRTPGRRVPQELVHLQRRLVCVVIVDALTLNLDVALDMIRMRLCLHGLRVPKLVQQIF